MLERPDERWAPPSEKYVANLIQRALRGLESVAENGEESMQSFLRRLDYGTEIDFSHHVGGLARPYGTRDFEEEYYDLLAEKAQTATDAAGFDFDTPAATGYLLPENWQLHAPHPRRAPHQDWPGYWSHKRRHQRATRVQGSLEYAGASLQETFLEDFCLEE